MIEEFLRSASWGAASRKPLAGDASARRYERLHLGQQTAVLMIAPPGDEMERFARIDSWLRDHGFSAPEVLQIDTAAGLMLLEDLGDDLVSRLVLREPAQEAPLYAAVTEFLLALHRLPPPDFVAALDGPALGALTGLTVTWYPVLSQDAAKSVPGLIEQVFAQFEPQAPVLSLRDLHAENLLWLPGRSGVQRLGLLDFQDAVAAHPAYDLVSALQDARRAVLPDTERREVARYVSTRGLDADAFGAAYALLGAQRALRILGVFCRLCLAMGKPGYLALMPQVWRNLARNLDHPMLVELRAAVLAAFPPPDEVMIGQMREACGQHPTR